MSLWSTHQSHLLNQDECWYCQDRKRKAACSPIVFWEFVGKNRAARGPTLKEQKRQRKMAKLKASLAKGTTDGSPVLQSVWAGDSDSVASGAESQSELGAVCEVEGA